MSITGYYVVKQTHEPIFRKEDGYNYTSRLFREWGRSVDSRGYLFCLKRGLEFYPGKAFQVSDFFSHLKTITGRFSSDVKVELKGECVTVEFFKPARGYLDYLCAYSNAPSVSVSSNVEAGLGSFFVDSIGGGKIGLRRRDKVVRGFNRIEIVEHAGGAAAPPSATGVADYNLALSRGELESLGPEYVRFDNLSLKSAVLLINIRDRELRKWTYNCLDIDDLRKAFAPEVKKFNYIQTVLPIGVPGALPGRPGQECYALKSGSRRSLVLANWRADKLEEMRAFASRFRDRTGVGIEVANYSPKELSGLMYARSKPYDLIIMMTTPDSDDNYRFLASYFGKKSLLDFEVPAIEGMYRSLLKADADSDKKALAAGIAESLSANHALLPIYQSVNTVYYPRRIRNLLVGKELFEYPDIAEFRW